MANPQVSVVMAVYNGELYLAGAIDSVLQQEEIEFEFIIVNDASEDNTDKLLQGYDDSRIRLLNNSSNQGLTKSLNTGIRIAGADFIARIDVDDIWAPGHLKRLSDLLLLQSEAVLVAGSHQEFFEKPDLKQLQTESSEYHEISKAQLLERNLFCHSAVMFRRQTGKKSVFYSENFKLSQDYELWLRLAGQGKLYKLNAVSCYYRRDIAALSLEHSFTQLKFARQAVKLAKEDSAGWYNSTAQLPLLNQTEVRELQAKACNIYLYFAFKLWRLGRKREAALLLWRSLGFSFLLTLKEALSLLRD